MPVNAAHYRCSLNIAPLCGDFATHGQYSLAHMPRHAHDYDAWSLYGRRYRRNVGGFTPICFCRLAPLCRLARSFWSREISTYAKSSLCDFTRRRHFMSKILVNFIDGSLYFEFDEADIDDDISLAFGRPSDRADLPPSIIAAGTRFPRRGGVFAAIFAGHSYYFPASSLRRIRHR